MCGSIVVWRYMPPHLADDIPLDTPSGTFYGVALYWVITCLSTVGFGDIYPSTMEAQLYTGPPPPCLARHHLNTRMSIQTRLEQKKAALSMCTASSLCLLEDTLH